MDTPKLCSAFRQLRLVEEIQKKSFKNNPSKEAESTAQTTKKLNFDANHITFKNLVSLNVNESMQSMHQPVVSIRTKKKSETKARPAPDLKDFLYPIPTYEHVVPEPKLCLKYSGFPDGFDVYKSLRTLPK